MSKRAPPPKFRHLPQDNNNNKKKHRFFSLLYLIASQKIQWCCVGETTYTIFLSFFFSSDDAFDIIHNGLRLKFRAQHNPDDDRIFSRAISYITV